MTPDRRHEEMEPLPFGELGRLEYDPVEDVLICHVCGGRYRNLAQHARLAHQLGADEYRKFGRAQQSDVPGHAHHA